MSGMHNCLECRLYANRENKENGERGDEVNKNRNEGNDARKIEYNEIKERKRT